ncbi:cysteine desulfurase [Alphaproteobacteria bacterium]|nr:cysteine desulfurase [Alphaproteobacteria bacterium]
MIYLDCNASAPISDEVMEAVIDAMRTTGNPSSVHAGGRAARTLVEDARGAVAQMVDAAAQNVIFTSGATEANNLAISGARRKRIIVSPVEHPSVLQAQTDMEVLTVDENGIVAPELLEIVLENSDECALVSVMLANNETGVIQPIAELVEIAHRHGALFHCDAVQAPGRLSFSMPSLAVDMLTLSAHKIGGPRGAGALILAPTVEIDRMIKGGGQERGRRSGTENVGAIVGFGEAAKRIPEILKGAKRIQSLRDELEERVLATISDAVIYGASVTRLPNTSNIGVKVGSAETQVIAMDMAGIAISAGSACSSGKVTSSHVLKAMGLSEAAAQSAIRVSLCPETTKSDIEHFLNAWVSHIKFVKDHADAA